jgi:hypothetical protein
MQPALPRLSLFPEDSSDLVVARAVALLISVCADCELSTASKYGALSLLVGARLCRGGCFQYGRGSRLQHALLSAPLLMMLSRAAAR